MNAIRLMAVLPLLALQLVSAQQIIPLYPGAIPNSKPVADEEVTERKGKLISISKISIPSIAVYIPTNTKSNGTAVIIFPGGGYWVNTMSYEGIDVAKQLNEWGVTAFVVKYRIPDERTMPDPSIGPLQDAQQAMLFVRSNAIKYGIDPKRIGVLGFSAGGHLAATIGTQYKRSLIDNPANVSLRPDFMILAYPVISTDTTISHKGSFDKLLGQHPTVEKLIAFSPEKQVTADTPPAFLVHAADDDVVPSDNSIVFYQALLRNKVRAELHIYERGGHGFGMINPTTNDSWMERCKNWMKSNGWLTGK